MLEDLWVQKNAECFNRFQQDNYDQNDLFDASFFYQEQIQQKVTEKIVISPSQILFWEDYRAENEGSPTVLQDSEGSRDESSCLEERVGGKMDDDLQKTARSKHNIFGYITKSAIRIMLKKYRNKIFMKVRKVNDFTFKEFQHMFGSKGNYMYGPEGFKRLFEGNNKRNMVSLFWKLFEKVLRNDYVNYVWSKGKMKEYETYIQIKNKYLLYVRELMEKNMME